MKFKVGDRVKIVKLLTEMDKGIINRLLGQVGTVDDIDEEWKYPYAIAFDDENINYDLYDLFLEDELELT